MEEEREREKRENRSFSPAHWLAILEPQHFKALAGLITSQDPSSSNFLQPYHVMSKIRGVENKQLQGVFIGD